MSDNPFVDMGSYLEVFGVKWTGRKFFIVVQAMQTGDPGSIEPDTNRPWTITGEISDMGFPVINGDKSYYENLFQDGGLTDGLLKPNRTTWIVPKDPPLPDPGKFAVFNVVDVGSEMDVFNDYYAFAFQRLMGEPVGDYYPFNEAIFLDLGTLMDLNETTEAAEIFKIKWKFYRRYGTFENRPILYKVSTVKFLGDPYPINLSITEPIGTPRPSNGVPDSYNYLERVFHKDAIVSELYQTFWAHESSWPNPVAIASVTCDREGGLSNFEIKKGDTPF